MLKLAHHLMFFFLSFRHLSTFFNTVLFNLSMDGCDDLKKESLFRLHFDQHDFEIRW